MFKPAEHKPQLPDTQVYPFYYRLRWQIFISIFFGYAAHCLRFFQIYHGISV